MTISNRFRKQFLSVESHSCSNCFLHLCYSEALWMHPLIRKTGCWKEKHFFGVVQHYQIWLCFYQEQLPQHKPTRIFFFSRQLLPQGCPLRGVPSNANRKALRALKQSEELLSIAGFEQPTSPITSSKKLGRWSWRWERGQQQSPGIVSVTSNLWVSLT